VSTRVPTIPRYDVTGTDAGMTPTHTGDYVCYDDFAKLERELAEAEACSIRLKLFVGEQKTKHETELAAEKARADAREAKAKTLRSQTDGNIEDFLNERACCSGEDCGCQGVSRLQQFVWEEAGLQLSALRAERDALAAQVTMLREALIDAQPLAIAWANYWTRSGAYGSGSEHPVHAEALAKIKAAIAATEAPAGHLLASARRAAEDLHVNLEEAS
jgi:hypothetical protein